MLGFDAYMDQAGEYSVEVIETTCGITVEQFHALIDLIMSAKNMVCSFGDGIELGRSGGSGLLLGCHYPR